MDGCYKNLWVTGISGKKVHACVDLKEMPSQVYSFVSLRKSLVFFFLKQLPI